MFFSSLTKDERPYFINDGLEVIYYLPIVEQISTNCGSIVL